MTAAPVRLAEVLSALSLATDVAMGQPMEHGLRTCLLTERLASRLELDPDTTHDAYELALLRWVGCTAHAHELSGWFDDEIAAHERAATFDFGRPAEVVADLLRHAGEGRPLPDRPARWRAPWPADRARCTGCSPRAARWPGAWPTGSSFDQRSRTGWPTCSPAGTGAAGRRSSTRTSPSSPGVVHVAQDAAVFHRLRGSAGATDVIRQRAGHAYDPAVADAFLTGAGELLDATEQPSLWQAVLDAEPGRRYYLTPEQVTPALEAMADFADLKSPWTAGHSRGAARLAETAARANGADDATAGTVRHAALVHDLGRVGVPNGIWDKPRPLTDGEWERVRLHPYLTERILARSRTLRPLGDIASLHHERLDGTGYHRGAKSATIPMEARLLAAADAYQSMTSDRAYRAAQPPAQAAVALGADARAGRLDPDAVRAVLAAAGQRPFSPRRRTEWPAGLTDREVEILRLLAQGHTRKQIAAELVISEKTAGHHAEHIYRKLGVSSRAAAALFAAQHDLV